MPRHPPPHGNAGILLSHLRQTGARPFGVRRLPRRHLPHLRHTAGTNRRSRHRLKRGVIITASGDNMIRTQISLEEREYAWVKKEAAALGIPIAEFVRRALRQALPVNDQAPWMRYAGLVESGDPHSSRSIDEIVYGTKD